MANKVLDPAKEPSRFLTIAYILALSLIAALTVGSHLIITRITESQKESAEIVYIGGRQRMLAPQIAFYGATFFRMEQERDRKSLADAIFNFELGHQFLIRNAQEESGLRRMSAELHAIYFESPYELDEQVKTYLGAAKTLAAEEYEDEDPDREEAYDLLLHMASGPLLVALDKAAQQYQNQNLEDIHRLGFIQLVMALVILLILVLEALFIFQPLVRHVQTYSRQLLKMAMKDPLTGLDNRRSFLELMDPILAKPDMRSFPLCVVLCDIDKFKSINDTYGHDVGDRVIQHFAGIMKRTLRTEDIIARIGGEEFALVLKRTPGDKGFVTIDRLRAAVEKTSCSYGEVGQAMGNLNYTASFGLVSVVQPGQTLDQLMKKADEGLYEAKNGGRNRVVRAYLDQPELSAGEDTEDDSAVTDEPSRDRRTRRAADDA